MDSLLNREIVRIKLLYPFLSIDQIKRRAKESLKKNGTKSNDVKKLSKNDNNNNVIRGKSVKSLQNDGKITDKGDVYDVRNNSEMEEIESLVTMRYKRIVNGSTSGSGSSQEIIESIKSDVEQEKANIDERFEMVATISKQTNTTTMLKEMNTATNLIQEEKENVKTTIKVSTAISPIHSKTVLASKNDEVPAKIIEKRIKPKLNRSIGIQVNFESKEIAEEVWQFRGETTAGVEMESIGTEIDNEFSMQNENEPPPMVKECEIMQHCETKTPSKKTRRQGTQTELFVVIDTHKKKRTPKTGRRAGAGILCDLFDTPSPKKSKHRRLSL